jgi:hypothetical protein
MGSLDDAIREHLELKRKHGAPDDEVKRQEEEAFGRRRPAQEPAEPTDEPASAVARDELGPEQLEAAEPQSNGQPASYTEPPAMESPPAAETPADVEQPPYEPDPLDADPFEPDEVPAEESLQPDVTVRDTREEAVDAEDTDERRDPESSNDPLEETPEFLEESPEEDRLWFEQRPPKDFDF